MIVAKVITVHLSIGNKIFFSERESFSLRSNSYIDIRTKHHLVAPLCICVLGCVGVRLHHFFIP